MQAIVPVLVGFLFLAIAVFGFVLFLVVGDPLGAIFFAGGFLVGSLAWFAVAAKIRGVRLGSLPDAFRAVFSRSSEPPA